MAAGATYTPIATTTLGSAAASYTFSSIPSTYTDLVLVFIGTATGGDYGIQFQLNGDTANNYSATRLYGTGTTAASTRYANNSGIFYGDIGTSPIVSNISHFQNYASTTTYKTVIGRQNNTNGEVNINAALWRSTAAINSIKVYLYSTNLGSGSQITLYGIAAA
jgi:hypothetical protein